LLNYRIPSEIFTAVSKGKLENEWQICCWDFNHWEFRQDFVTSFLFAGKSSLHQCAATLSIQIDDHLQKQMQFNSLIQDFWEYYNFH
jgi:hypothetical protein